MTGTTSRIIHSGGLPGIDEALDDLEPLDDLLGLQLGLGGRELVHERLRSPLEVEVHEHVLDGFGADAGGEGVFAIFVLRVEQLVLVEQLIASRAGSGPAR